MISEDAAVEKIIFQKLFLRRGFMVHEAACRLRGLEAYLRSLSQALLNPSWSFIVMKV